MGLVQVAQAIAKEKVRVTVADLDRLIRMEEFLKEDLAAMQNRRIRNTKQVMSSMRTRLPQTKRIDTFRDQLRMQSVRQPWERGPQVSWHEALGTREGRADSHS